MTRKLETISLHTIEIFHQICHFKTKTLTVYQDTVMKGTDMRTDFL